MVNFKKTLQQQEKINEAAQKVLKFYDDVATYSDVMEDMAKAQTAILVMATHYHRLLSQFTDEEDKPFHEDITQFLWIVSELLDATKPFADLLGQIYGKDSD
jgi:hypothetical protein